MKADLRNYHRLSAVGRALIAGPFSIKPPKAIDDYGWLECALRIVHTVHGHLETAAVYVDDSTNREADFLPPMIRHAVWDRGGDMEKAKGKEITWPSVEVALSFIDDSRASVDLCIRQVEEVISNLPYVPFGLWTDRSMPEVEPERRGLLEVYVSNGAQKAEYSCSSAQDRAVYDAALGALATLRALVQPIDVSGWRESYRHEFASMGEIYWWNYTPDPLHQAP